MLMGKNYDAESWLISPELAISKNANAVLTFTQAVNFFSNINVAKEEATVNVREKGGKWVALTIPNYPSKLSWSFEESGDIDLSAYNGKTIQIGFCYKSTAAKSGTWEIDAVKLADGGKEGNLQELQPWKCPQSRNLQSTNMTEANGLCRVLPMCSSHPTMRQWVSLMAILAATFPSRCFPNMPPEAAICIGRCLNIRSLQIL